MNISEAAGGFRVVEEYSRNGKSGQSRYLGSQVGDRMLNLTVEEPDHDEGFEYTVILTISDDGQAVSGRYVGHPNCTTMELAAT